MLGPGWWQYDERTCKELEVCYKAGERTCELLIAGFLYVTDLEAMLQLRRNDPSRRRRIKRDLSSVPKKGIAGLRTEVEDENNTDYQRSTCLVEGRTDILTPVTPSNTPQSPPPSGRESLSVNDLQTTIDRIQSLTLQSDDNVEDSSNFQIESSTTELQNNRIRNVNCRHIPRRNNIN